MKKLTKKGQVSGVVAVVAAIAALALAFGVSVVISALITQVVDDFHSTQTASSLAANATTRGLDGMTNFTDNYTTIGTVLGATILILVVVGGLGFFIGRRALG